MLVQECSQLLRALIRVVGAAAEGFGFRDDIDRLRVGRPQRVAGLDSLCGETRGVLNDSQRGVAGPADGGEEGLVGTDAAGLDGGREGSVGDSEGGVAGGGPWACRVWGGKQNRGL